jgi:hypothetical protein
VFISPTYTNLQALHKVLSQLPPDDPKSHQRQQECSPTVFQQLLHTNFNIAALLPKLTASTLSQLKQIMEETVETAASFTPAMEQTQGGAAGFTTRTKDYAGIDMEVTVQCFLATFNQVLLNMQKKKIIINKACM